MGEHDLLQCFAQLLQTDRTSTVQLLRAIAEIDERKLWAKHAYPSMFEFCVQRFGMSEPATAKRVWVAGCNMFSLQVFGTVVWVGSTDRNGEATPCKTQSMRYINKSRLFDDNVLTNNTDIGNAVADVSRNVVISQEVKINGKIVGRREKTLTASLESNPHLIEQLQGPFAEPSGTLKCKPEPFLCHVYRHVDLGPAGST